MTRLLAIGLIALAWAGPAGAQEEEEEQQAPRAATGETAEPVASDEPARPATSHSSRTAAPARTAEPGPVRVVVNRQPAEEEEEEPVDETDHYDILWIELFGGASYVDLRAIRFSNYYPEFVRLAGWGPAGGLALGFRVEFVSVGIRAALARYDVSDASAPDAVFDVGTGVAEVKLALPIPVVQPFVRVGIGFGWHGDSNFRAPSMSQTTVFGWAFEGAIGVDIYVAHWFAIGAAFTIDILNMNRQSFSEPVSDPGMVEFREGGDAVGAQARAHVTLGLHF